MNSYRELNKELVNQVQKMRRDLQLYSDEIVRLKQELMDRNESELFFRSRCYNLAVNNFIQLVQYMQPESDILPNLTEHLQSQERIFHRSSVHEKTVCCSDNETISRRSSILAMELQRSNSIVQVRKSQRSMSPLRKNSIDENKEKRAVTKNSQSILGDTEDENNESIDKDLLPTLSPINDIIFEDSAEEDDPELLEHDFAIEIDDSSSRTNLLKDLTNIDSDRGKLKLTKSSVHQNTFSENSLVDMEITLQEARILSDGVCVAEANNLHTTKEHNHVNSEVSMNSSKSDCIDMTIRNFENLACSTPNSLRDSPLNETSSKCHPTKDLCTSSDSVMASARPSRKCKPVCLIEPKRKSKLRNETTTKPKLKKSKSIKKIV